MNTSNEKIDAVIEACKMGLASFDPNVLWWDRVFEILIGCLIFGGFALAILGFLYIISKIN